MLPCSVRNDDKRELRRVRIKELWEAGRGGKWPKGEHVRGRMFRRGSGGRRVRHNGANERCALTAV